MKKITYIIVLFLSNFLCLAQEIPKLVAVKTNNNNGVFQIDLGKWTLGNTTFNYLNSNVCESVVLATSFYDSFTSNFYFKAGNTNNLVKFNTFENTIAYLNVFNDNAMYETQVDMQNGDYYTIKLSNGEQKLYKNNQFFSNSNHLGDFPSISSSNPFYNRSSTYDSNNKKLYFIRGFNNQISLFKTNLNDNSFSYNVLPLVNFPSNHGNMFLGYSNQNNILYCALATGNVTDQTAMMRVGKINTQTGVYEELMTVDNLKYFINFCVLFDQFSNSFVIYGSNYDFVKKLYWINPTNQTTSLHDLPNNNLIEIQIDNSKFSKSFYSPLNSSNYEIEKISLYPNPASNYLKINIKGNFKYTIFNQMGQKLLYNEVENNTNLINIENLSTGIYHILIENTIEKSSLKFVKK